MKELYELKEKLCEELEELARKQEMGAGDLEVIHKLTDTIKNIDKICMLEEEGYSEDGYGGGSSYANRGKHYVRGHYSREGGSSYDGGSYEGGGQGGGGYSSRRGGGRGGRGGSRRGGGYSRDDGRSEMMEHLEMALDSANEEDRETIKRFMQKLENA